MCFDEMSVRGLVSWKLEFHDRWFCVEWKGRKALLCFKDLPGYPSEKNDRFGIMSALAACSLEASKSRREVHCYMIRNGLENDIMVKISLLDMDRNMS
jgi:hypothetical protein